MKAPVKESLTTKAVASLLVMADTFEYNDKNKAIHYRGIAERLAEKIKNNRLLLSQNGL